MLGKVILEKTYIVNATTMTKKGRYNDKAYGYKYGAVYLHFPPELIGRKVRVIVIEEE